METQSVYTTHGELKYYRDWDNSEGGIVMIHPKTINRYYALKYKIATSVSLADYDCFVTFSREELDKKYAEFRASGKLKDGEKLVQTGVGVFGTHEGLERLGAFYESINEQVRQCDPQEVYFWEWNNHECMFDWDGDKRAMESVINIWGKEVAKNLVRINPCDIDEVFKD